MRIGIATLGQVSLVATAEPPMPANVQAAYNVLQPYLNDLTGLVASGPGNANAAFSCPPFSSASIPNGFSLLSSAQQAALIAPYQALYSALPTMLVNAPIVDAYNTSVGDPMQYTPMVKCAQTYLTSLFRALGIALPSQGSSSGSSIPQGALMIAGIALLLAFLVMNR